VLLESFRKWPFRKDYHSGLWAGSPATQLGVPKNEPKHSASGLLHKTGSHIGSHGVPLISSSGPMQQSGAGEGDTSGLLMAPWTTNGMDAWKDIRPHPGSTGLKGQSTFGGELPGQPGTKLSTPKIRSEFARGFLAKCAECGYSPEQTCNAAKQASMLSDKIALELEPIVKQAMTPLPHSSSKSSMYRSRGHGWVQFAPVPPESPPPLRL